MKSLNKKIKALLVLFSFVAYMPVSVMPTFALSETAAPELNSSINGGYVGWHEGSSAATGGKYDVTVNAPQSGAALFNWNKFNVGSKVTVDWIFKHANSTAYNRVLNNGGMSEIYGKLTSSCAAGGNCDPGNHASGNVILINPNGILFGEGSQVNLNSFTASTYDVTGMNQFDDMIKNGTAMDGSKLVKTTIEGNDLNYQFTGDDKFSQKYTYGNTITYDRLNNKISAVGEGNLAGITIRGAHFNSKDIETGAPLYENNQPTTQAVAINMVSNKIDIDDSTLQTFVPNKKADGTYDATGNNGWDVARSGVKLITADGVSFVYDEIGGTKNTHTIGKNVSAANAGNYGVDINNSTIWTGDTQIKNGFTNTDVIINNSTIASNKVADQIGGKIAIGSKNNVIITDSRLETLAADNGETTNQYGLGYGDIEIKADNNIIATDSRIVSANSDINSRLGVDSTLSPVGNITLDAGNGVMIQTTGKTNTQLWQPTDGVDVSAGGNLTVKAGLTDVVIDTVKGTKVESRQKDVKIAGRNILIENAEVLGQNIGITAGKVDTVANASTNDGYGNANGSIVIKGAIVDAYGDGVNLDRKVDIQGLNTTISNTLLAYDEINFTPDETSNLNNVLLHGNTTVFDREAASKAEGLVLQTNGMLVIDNNELQKKDYHDVEAVNQGTDIVLKSTNSLVSIRNNSNITTAGNVKLDGATTASVATSNVTAGKNIEIKGDEAVTVGDTIQYPQTGDTIVQRGSNLTAQNIKLETTGNNVSNVQGITVDSSTLNATAGNNTITAAKGTVAIQDGSTVSATGNNTITTLAAGKNTDINGNVYITKDVIVDASTVHANGNNALTSGQGAASIQNGSTLTAGGTSDITANGIAQVLASTVQANNTNTITSEANKVIVGATGKVESVNTDTIINQYLTANLDSDFAGQVKAANNIQLNVTGTGNDITGSNLGKFVYGNRLGLDADDTITLAKAGDWTLTNVDFNSKANNITSTNGNVTVTGDIALGSKAVGAAANKDNRTTIAAGNNIKTNLVKANGKKLIANAGKEIDLTFTGVNNKSAGLEVNSNINTLGSANKAQSANNSNLNGKNVKLTAADGNLTVSKIKANRLTINGTNKLTAATDNEPNAARDNVGTTQYMANQGTAYIEVREVGGWNMDTDVANDQNIPNFYNKHYDGIDTVTEAENGDKITTTTTQRHQLQFDGDSDKILLVYERVTNKDVDPCDTPIIPVGPQVDTTVEVDRGLTETTLARLPRHEEGVSAVAPVLNEITDPTANVIMAAARLTLDDENEASEEDETIEGAF